MKDLTSQDKIKLLGKIKSFLSITWEDDSLDTQLMNFAISSINRLDNICGVELDYVNDSQVDPQYQALCMLGQDLMLNRIFYLNEKGLDDFEKNYSGELVALVVEGKIYVNKQ